MEVEGGQGSIKGFHGQEVLSTQGKPLGMNCCTEMTGLQHGLRIDGFHLLGNIG